MYYPEMIKKLTEAGVSKYYIAKALKVSWQTVHAWSRGWWKPRGKNALKLKKMYELKVKKGGKL